MPPRKPKSKKASTANSAALDNAPITANNSASDNAPVTLPAIDLRALRQAIAGAFFYWPAENPPACTLDDIMKHIGPVPREYEVEKILTEAVSDGFLMLIMDGASPTKSWTPTSHRNAMRLYVDSATPQWRATPAGQIISLLASQ
jgi:hypothetical protein